MALTPRPSLVSRTVPAKSEIAPYPVDAMLAMSAAGSIARVTSAARIIRSPTRHRRDQRDLVASINELVRGDKLSVDGDAGRVRKDRSAWEQTQMVQEIRDRAADFERELERGGAETFGV